MGISDDIKPKKSYRYSSRKEKDNFVDDDEDDIEEEENEPEKNKDDLENDFFDDAKNKHRDMPRVEAEPKEHHHSPIGKIILILMVLTLIIVIIYQNFDLVKNLAGDKLNIFSNNQNSAVTESNQNLNGNNNGNLNTNANQNLNSNQSNANANTNTAPAIDKTAVVMEVLNGNGITGSADKVRDLLVTAGYSVAKVANAKKFTYPDTLIYYKTGQEAVAADIKATLTGYQTAIENSDTVVGSYDIVVIVGKL